MKQRRYDIACFSFPKKISEHPNYFTIFGISTGVSQQIGRISAITLDAEFIWDGSDRNGIELPSGVYFYTAEFNKYRIDGRIVKIGN